MKNVYCVTVLLGLLLCSCAVSKNVSPPRKYGPQTLQADYALFRKILENDHPGLYWYTPKDSMDFYFDRGKAMLHDSLTETGFRNVLSYVLAKVRCGHTSVEPSKHFYRLPDSLRNRPFPLSLKIWKDTAIVAANLNRRDSNLLAGVLITAIDGKPMPYIVDSLFQFLSGDGYNLTHKYQSLSNRGSFGSAYVNHFGHRAKYVVDYIDTLGNHRTTAVRLFAPVRDTTHKPPPTPQPLSRSKIRKLNLELSRNLRMDTALQTGFMELNTFTKDAHLRPFFKSTFKRLKKEHSKNLVIDLRGNGGGSVTSSNLLTRYVTSEPFKIADTLYTLHKSSRYDRYQQHRFWNWLFLVFMTHKEKDGLYHFRYFEHKEYGPKKKNHFSGQVYVLTGGNTFSASTLVAHALRDQPNVTIVGEETGGGAYGNDAWLIPDVTLPRTGVRFRLPLFRLVIDHTEPKGWGVQPEVEVLPTVKAIRRQADYKMEKVLELIKKNEASTAQHK